MCRACLDSPSVKRAIELGSWWREVPFMINHARDGEAAERAPLTNGRVDLVVPRGATSWWSSTTRPTGA